MKSVCFQTRIKEDHFQKYHITLCLPLQNFAYVLLLFSLASIVSPKRKWRKCLCKILEGQIKIIMVFSKVAYQLGQNAIMSLTSARGESLDL